MLKHSSVDFKYEGKLYSVRIVGCSVFPQDYAAIVPYLNDMTGLNSIVDTHLHKKICWDCIKNIRKKLMTFTNAYSSTV